MDADPNQHPLVKKGVMLAVMFALPLTDTLTVVFKRIRRGRSPFIGGRDHTTHHLSYLGLSDRKVAIVYLCIAFCSSTLFILGSTLPYWGWWYTILFCLFFLLVFVALFVIANRNTGKSV
jgi:UDP-GlcNAc:undecaprenyl-phosphate GlcNAc-1-phosphate transferase